MKRNAILALFLAAALLAGIFAGCGDGGSSPAEDSGSPANTSESSAASSTQASEGASESGGSGMPLFDSPTEMTMFWSWNGSAALIMSGFEENLVWQEMEKLTNVKLKFVTPPLGQAEEQFNLIMASGEFPDMIWSDNIKYPGGGDKAIADGNYINLNDYLEYAPNYNALINSSDDIFKQVHTDEGNLWGFPMIEKDVQGAWLGLLTRKDWLDDLGLDIPVTYDDWEVALTKFKEEKGASAPLSLDVSGVWRDCNSLLSGFGVGSEFFQVDNVVKYGPIGEGYREYLTLLSDWYQKGLIDQDFTTREGSQLQNFYLTGEIGLWRDGFWMLDLYYNQAEEPGYQLTAVPTPVKSAGDVAHLRQTNYNNRELYMSISTNCKYPVEAVKFIDYLYGDDGFLLCNYGIEGLSYEYGSDGQPAYTELMTSNEDGFGTDIMLQKYALQGGPFNRLWDREMFTYGEDAQNCEPIWNTADSAYVLPPVTLTAEEGDLNASLMGDIKTLVNESTVKFIMGEKPMSEFDAFAEQIKSMGIDRVLETQQAALDRYNAR